MFAAVQRYILSSVTSFMANYRHQPDPVSFGSSLQEETPVAEILSKGVRALGMKMSSNNVYKGAEGASQPRAPGPPVFRKTPREV